MGSPIGALRPDNPGTHARRSPSPRAPSPPAPDDTDDASIPGKRLPEIAHRIKTPGQALHDAVGRKDLDGVTRILRVFPDIVDAKGEQGETALLVATHYDKNEIIKLLILKGAKVDARSGQGMTALHLAAHYGKHDIVKLLILKGAKVDARGEEGRTALHLAADSGQLDIIKLLILKGAKVDAKTDRGETALHFAAYFGENEILKLLISKGAEVDARSEREQTPLHRATQASRQDVVMMLLDAGADVQGVELDGLTPLHIVVCKKGKTKQELLVILLARGANCSTQDNEGRTPLQGAVMLGNLTHARALCAFGADPYLKDKYGYDAFDYAKRLEGGLGGEMADIMSKWVKGGKQTRKILPQLAKFITEEGRIDVSEMLSWVSGTRYEMLVEFILDYMARDTPEIVEFEDSKKGWRPLHHAAWAGQTKVCEILLAHGAAVDAEAGTQKETPLHLAARKGRQRTLRVLLDHGADILATAEMTPPWRIGTDTHSQTPVLLKRATSFWLAANGYHTKSLEVLLEYARRIKDDKRRIAAMDDYTKARHYLATLSGQGDDSRSGKDDDSSTEPDHQAQVVRPTPSLLPELDVPGTSGSFDGAFFSVPATSLELSHSDTYQMLLGIWDNFDFKKKYDRPVKIAVLDTGLDINHQSFQNPRVTHFVGGKPVWASKQEPSQYDRIKACEDFTGDGPIERKDDMKDLDGHGTQVTELILRLAPRSELYIARICEGEINRGTHTKSAPTDNPIKRPRPDIVARAIDWAREQGVDIINMSFGFRDRHRGVKTALINARDSKILVFAAMSNDGNNSDHAAWPARDHTLAIGVHSCDHWGNRSPFTPHRVNGSHNFMFVGEKVITQWPEAKGGGFRLDNGTSFATPAVAAMAALILGFAWQHMCRKEREEAERHVDLEELRELGGMGKVLERISKKDSFQWYSYIHPQLLWKGFSPGLEDDRSKVRQHAWDILVESLSL